MEIQLSGLKELQVAFGKSPETVMLHWGYFGRRMMAVFQSKIRRTPWRVGESGSGKGVPYKTGNLSESHGVTQGKYEFRFGVDELRANYALAVSKTRPWLDVAMRESGRELQENTDRMLEDITNDLAK